MSTDAEVMAIFEQMDVTRLQELLDFQEQQEQGTASRHLTSLPPVTSEASAPDCLTMGSALPATAAHQ
jgi:hypothetical protein